MVIGWLIVLAACLCLILGAPLFTALGVVTLACVQFLGDGYLVEIIADMFNTVNKDMLLAIPFFVAAGQIMTEGAIARRLVSTAQAWVGWLPAGLAVTGVAACVFFAAISGSSAVTLIAVGSVLYPALRKASYPEKFSLGLLTTGGSLGVLVPPSIPMILYGVVVSTPSMPVPVGDLYLAGILPALLIAAALAGYSMWTHRKMARERFKLREALNATRQGFWSLLLPFIVLGSIYTGKCTATEASAVAVVYALVVELFIHKSISIRKVPDMLMQGGLTMGTLFLVIVLSQSLNQYLALEQIPQRLAAGIQGVITSKWMFAIAVNLFLLIAGCPMDMMSAILLLGPILSPMAAAYGFDPVHFAIIFIVNMEIGYLSPPIGLNLFIASSVFKAPMDKVVSACVPYMGILIVCLGAITWLPGLSLWLVHLMK
ncbi:MAG: C4-dicarboxylate transporter permease [Fibrobacteres bacterium]|nr:C4-dicarboxylate transporter permease [Fibrobacterota bacterium]